MDYRERLESMRETWDENSHRGGVGVPDGVYNCRLQNIKVDESQSEKLMVHAEYLIYEGEQASQVIHQFISLETEWGPSRVRQTLERLDWTFPDDPVELEETLASVADAAPACRVRVSTKTTNVGEFTNVAVMRRLEDGDLPPEPEVPTEENKPAVTAAKPKVQTAPSTAAAKKAAAAVAAPPASTGPAPGQQVQWEYKNEIHQGEVTKVMGDKLWVKDTSDGRTKVVAVAEAVEVEQEAPATEGQEAASDIRNALETFCLTYQLDFDDQNTDQELIALVVDHEPWPREELIEEEIALLEKIGAPFAGAAPAKGKATKTTTAAKKTTADPMVAKLVHLLDSYTEEKPAKNASVDVLKDLVLQYEWPKKSLSAEELATLKAIGVRPV